MCLLPCCYLGHTGVCEQNTPPEKKTLGITSMNNTKSGAGKEFQFLLLFCRAEARATGMFLFHRHPYDDNSIYDMYLILIEYLYLQPCAVNFIDYMYVYVYMNPWSYMYICMYVHACHDALVSRVHVCVYAYHILYTRMCTYIPILYRICSRRHTLLSPKFPLCQGASVSSYMPRDSKGPCRTY